MTIIEFPDRRTLPPLPSLHALRPSPPAEERGPAPDAGEVASALASAAANDELSLAFQPAVELDTGRMVGLEALLRWHHPDFGMVPPGAFIPIAEETGLINRLGAWVLRAACEQVRTWLDRYPDASDLRVFVNVSPRQLGRPGFSDVVEAALRRCELRPSQLLLEMTGSTMAGDQDTASDMIHELREIGVGIALDDLGTTRSPLSTLRRAPVDVVKIDRGSVRGVASHRVDRAVVAGLLTMARSLGVTAIAEGVEHLDQLEALRDLGCPVGQGFFWSHPTSPAELEAWFAQPPTPLFPRRRAQAAAPFPGPATA